VGVSKDVVYRWVKAYQERGEAGLRNQVRSSESRRRLPGPVRATFLGQFLSTHREAIRMAGGILIILFGLFSSGIFSLDFLQREKKLLQTHYRGTNYRPASVNRELEVMRRIFNLAMRDDRVEKNPCWKVTRLSQKNARDRVLSGEELNTLLKKLPQHAADIVAVGYHTGMRAGEIFDLTWDRVNLKEGLFILESEDTKTGDPRHVYFNGPVREILERVGKVRPISHNHGFTYHAKPLKSIKTALANALEKTGIKNFRFHDLRHTWTTNARRAGVDRTVIMKLTGHRTLSMFTRYNSVDEDDAKQALSGGSYLR